MTTDFLVNAEPRTDYGKGAMRRLRITGQVPGIMYGAGIDPQAIHIKHSDISKQLENEAFYSHVLSININGISQKAVLKDLQRHPSKPKILHIDFLRVSDKQKINMNVPLHFIGEDIAPGVKTSGGLVSHQMTNVEIVCFAKDLPEFIEVDLSHLELNEAIHLSDLKLPNGVEIVGIEQGPEHDLPVARIHLTRGSDGDTASDEAQGSAES
jgi:large subunit ribosomal protein L25